MVDAPTAAPAPLQPVDLTDDAQVAEVLDIAVRSGEVLLASGTSAIDTTAQVQFVASTYGLARCDVDVTYNSIRISAYRGPTMPPATSMRIVHYRSLDFTRLAAVDALTRRLRTEAVSPGEAHDALTTINDAPHPYNRWTATFAWASMAASASVLLGGGLLVAIVSFLTTMVIDRVNRMLNGIGLPFFYQHVVGGLIAAAPASLLYTFREQLGISIRPSLVIAAGVIVLLSGLSLVGSVQDAITGAPITAVARFFEVLMMTGGIIAGVALSLRMAAALGSTLPLTTAPETPAFAQISIRVVAGAFTSLFFAVACYAERRALTAAGLGGAAGILGVLAEPDRRHRDGGRVGDRGDGGRLRRWPDGAAGVDTAAGDRGRGDHPAASRSLALPGSVLVAERPTAAGAERVAVRVRNRRRAGRGRHARRMGSPDAAAAADTRPDRLAPAPDAASPQAGRPGANGLTSCSRPPCPSPWPHADSWAACRSSSSRRTRRMPDGCPRRTPHATPAARQRRSATANAGPRRSRGRRNGRLRRRKGLVLIWPRLSRTRSSNDPPAWKPRHYQDRGQRFDFVAGK